METADFDLNDFNPQHAEADKALLVRFFTQPLKNEEKSTNEGRPIFDDTEMVEIRVRGQKDNVVLREVRPDDKARFRDAYKFFREGKSLSDSGTPLSAWPIITASQVEEFKYLGFYTVEHIASAGEQVLGRVPGLLSLKNRANAFLEAAKGNAPLEKMNKELEDKQNQITTMQNQMAEMQRQMATLTAQLEKKK
jgi:hypothetical protein